MKNKIAIFSILLLLFGCISKKSNDFATVKAPFNPEGNKKIEIYLNNEPPIGQSKYTCHLNEDSVFLIEIPISSIKTGIIYVGNYHYDFCLQPNDEIEIIKPKGDTIFYNGHGAGKNNFLYHAERKGLSERSFHSDFNKRKVSPADFLKRLSILKEKRYELLNKNQNKYNLSNEFIDFYSKQTQLTFENLIIKYPGYLKNKAYKIPDVIRKLSVFSNIINDSNLFSSTYLNTIDYLVYKKSLSLAKSNSLSIADARQIILLDSLFGQTQVYVLLNDISSSFTYGANYDTILITKFNSLDCDQVAKNEFNRLLAKHLEKEKLIGQKLHSAFASSILLDTANKEITFGEMMANLKGNVVYLDIWATTCSPCRYEMQFSKKLKEKFKDDQIEFVYISTELSDTLKWNSIYKITGTRDNHFIYKKEFQSKMLEFMEINGIPNYMLFDKEGKLVNYQAIRPSETSEIDEILNALIK